MVLFHFNMSKEVKLIVVFKLQYLYFYLSDECAYFWHHWLRGLSCWRFASSVVKERAEESRYLKLNQIKGPSLSPPTLHTYLRYSCRCDWQARWITWTNQRRDVLIGQKLLGCGLKSKWSHTEVAQSTSTGRSPISLTVCPQVTRPLLIVPKQ